MKRLIKGHTANLEADEDGQPAPTPAQEGSASARQAGSVLFTAPPYDSPWTLEILLTYLWVFLCLS